MTRWFVTPDLHGRAALAEGLLRAAGVPLLVDARVEQGIVSVQLGDLANCVPRDARRDAEILRAARRWFDVVLVGNHEHPYWGGPRFAGYMRIPEVEEGLRQLERAGRIYPCLLVGDVLLTHAGVTPEWGFESAEAASERIQNVWWGRGRDYAIFSQIGRARRGQLPYGGILWSDFREPRAEFRQIHGHTPLPNGPQAKAAPDGEPVMIGICSMPGQGSHPGSVNLDVGGRHGRRVVGAWLDEDGAFETIEYRADA